jgi:hypothetical protein
MPGETYVAQVVMWNPGVFPQNPEQGSNIVTFVIPTSGRIQAHYSGAQDGMDLQCETIMGADGKRYLSFPFTIDGL